MRAVHVDSDFLDFSLAIVEVEHELSGALLAGHQLADEFAVHAQLAAAMRALYVVPAHRKFHEALDFLQRNELGNLDAVRLEIGVQQRTAIAAMNHPFG